MFELVEEILGKLGCPELLTKFVEEEIDDDLLEDLTEDHMKHLLPLGKRIRFMKAIKQKKEQSSFENNQNDLNATLEDSTQFSVMELSGGSKRDGCTNFDHVFAQRMEEVDVDKICVSPTKRARKQESPRKMAPVPVASTSSPATNYNVEQTPRNIALNPVASTSSPATSCNDEQTERCLLVDNVAKLKKMLQESDEGKGVLIHYERKNMLSRKASLKLCELILRYEFQGNPERKLKMPHFKLLASIIVELFPSEFAETYYVPSEGTVSKGNKASARGRLVIKYNARKKDFREAGLLGGPTCSTVSSSPSIIEADATVKIDWLRENGDAKDEDIENAWKLTFSYRSSNFNDGNLIDYLAKFKFLKRSELGKKLIKGDFVRLFPDQHKNFSKNWSSVADKIIKYCQDKKIKDPSWLLDLHQSNLNFDSITPDTKDTFALAILPFLFRKPGNLNRNKKGCPPWKPGRKDIANSFLFQVPNSNFFDSDLTERRDYFAYYKAKFQPTTIIIGSVDGLYQFFVVLNDIRYQFNDAVEAFEFCFQVFYVFNLEYPIDCAQSYLFIEKFVFQINASKTKNLLEVSDLGKELNLV